MTPERERNYRAMVMEALTDPLHRKNLVANDLATALEKALDEREMLIEVMQEIKEAESHLNLRNKAHSVLVLVTGR